MSFILEDGTGEVAGANSYASNAQFQAYFADRLQVVSAVQATVEAALIRATDYLHIRFRWKGYKLLPETQPLDWPRCDVWTRDGVYIVGLPVELVQATIEYARRALEAPLAPDPAVDASGMVVTSTREKIGPIETELGYSGGGPSAFVPYPAADRLLRDLHYPEGGRVYRA